MIHRVFGIILPAPGVCSDQKTLHGCGPGSKREKFMKKHCRKTCGLCEMLVLVTGGMSPGGDLDSVELLNMDGTWNCPMPPLPVPRFGHSQTGAVTCGGHKDGSYEVTVQKSCVTLSSDWEQTHNLTARWGRWDHSAWRSPRGVVLMGGGLYPGWRGQGERIPYLTTTEILTQDGDTPPVFTLSYETM